MFPFFIITFSLIQSLLSRSGALIFVGDDGGVAVKGFELLTLLDDDDADIVAAIAVDDDVDDDDTLRLACFCCWWC